MQLQEQLKKQLEMNKMLIDQTAPTALNDQKDEGDDEFDHN